MVLVKIIVCWKNVSSLTVLMTQYSSHKDAKKRLCPHIPISLKEIGIVSCNFEKRPKVEKGTKWSLDGTKESH